jgi:hypothetical protein
MPVGRKPAVLWTNDAIRKEFPHTSSYGHPPREAFGETAVNRFPRWERSTNIFPPLLKQQITHLHYPVAHGCRCQESHKTAHSAFMPMLVTLFLIKA